MKRKCVQRSDLWKWLQSDQMREKRKRVRAGEIAWERWRNNVSPTSVKVSLLSVTAMPMTSCHVLSQRARACWLHRTKLYSLLRFRLAGDGWQYAACSTLYTNRIGCSRSNVHCILLNKLTLVSGIASKWMDLCTFAKLARYAVSSAPCIFSNFILKCGFDTHSGLRTHVSHIGGWCQWKWHVKQVKCGRKWSGIFECECMANGQTQKRNETKPNEIEIDSNNGAKIITTTFEGASTLCSHFNAANVHYESCIRCKGKALNSCQHDGGYRAIRWVY